LFATINENSPVQFTVNLETVIFVTSTICVIWSYSPINRPKYLPAVNRG